MDKSDKIEACAHVAHEVNRAYCEANGDHSQVPWEDAPAWQKNSAREGVLALMNNPSLTPEDTHASWMRHKIADGWSYGPEKDPERKTHPCIVAYESLPRFQRRKDILFSATVRSTLNHFAEAERRGETP